MIYRARNTITDRGRPALRPQFRLAGLLGALTLSACGNNSAAGDPAQMFTLTRNADGVAQIQAPGLSSAAAGLGYAYAQDNFCLLQDYLLTVNGERSKYLGADATVATQTAHASASNLASDTFYKFYVDGSQADQLYAMADVNTTDLIAGYVAGVNRYIKETPATKIDATCQGKPWLRTMTLTDARKILLDKAILASGANFIVPITSARPPSTQASAPPTQVAARSLAGLGLPDVPLASNGWAFGRDTVEGGGSLLFGNPHFPWSTANRFYQARMTVPGVLDVTGAALGGVPIVQIGYNKNFAWSHTVSTGKRFTLYELALKAGDPLSYVVDGVEKAMKPVDVTVEVLSSTGLKNVTQRLYKTDFGAVLSIPAAGLGWSGQHAYALADVNLTNNRMLKAWLQLGQATSVRQAQAALSSTIGIPWVNTIASDSSGEVLYADITPVPNVDTPDLARCAPAPAAAALLKAAGLVVLNGATASCQWTTDAGTPAPGLTPASRLASAIRTDYVANSNDSYWLANPAITWPMFSPLLGPVDATQRPRTRAALNMFQRRFAGTDGLPGTRFSAESLKSLWYRSENFMAENVLDDLLAQCPGNPSVTLAGGAVVSTTGACAALAAWDRRSDTSSKGAHLFREFWRNAATIPNVYAVPFDPKNPITTPRGLKASDPVVRAAILQALGKAIEMFQSAGVAMDAPLGALQRLTVSGKAISVPGGDEFEGVLNKQESNGFINGSYQPFYGSSYVQLINFGSGAASAQGILVYSQSTDQSSPYFGNQLPVYAEHRLLPLPTP